MLFRSPQIPVNAHRTFPSILHLSAVYQHKISYAIDRFPLINFLGSFFFSSFFFSFSHPSPYLPPQPRCYHRKGIPGREVVFITDIRHRYVDTLYLSDWLTRHLTGATYERFHLRIFIIQLVLLGGGEGRGGETAVILITRQLH